MWNWTIRRRILGSFGLLLALIFVMGSSVFLEMTGMVRAAGKLRTDALAGLSESNALKAGWTATYLLAEQYGYLEDREASEALAQKLHGQHTQIDDEDSAYKRSISDQEDRDRFDAYQKAAASYVQAEERLIHAAPGRRAAENRALLTGDVAPAYSNVEAALKSIDEWNVSVANASAQKVESEAQYIRKLIIACFAVIVAVAVLACLFLWRAVTQPLGRLLANTEIVSRGDFTNRIALPQRDEFGSLADAFNRMVGELTGLVDQVQKAAIQVNTSVTEIGATSTEQQATATEIAATTTEIGATSREISATSRELVATMTEVAGVAGQTAGLADNGQAGLSRMEIAMRGVSEAASSVSTKLGVLSEKAGNINQVVTTITKVADQTNLLSLNAAIEAEKAGEAGRGFAVVATEIRRLADQTAVATYDIEQTVKEIQSAVSAGVMSMDKFSEQVRRGMHEMQQVGALLSQIIHQVQALAPRFETVNEGMQAQATGAEQISDALTQLTEASQQTVQSLRQSNEAIGGLNQVASALRGAVSRFKLA